MSISRFDRSFPSQAWQAAASPETRHKFSKGSTASLTPHSRETAGTQRAKSAEGLWNMIDGRATVDGQSSRAFMFSWSHGACESRETSLLGLARCPFQTRTDGASRSLPQAHPAAAWLEEGSVTCSWLRCVSPSACCCGRPRASRAGLTNVS